MAYSSQATSRGWMDAIPHKIYIQNFGSAGIRTRDLMGKDRYIFKPCAVFPLYFAERNSYLKYIGRAKYLYFEHL